MFISKAAVVGAGTMGGQIAQTIAAAGIPVLLKDIKQELVDAGIAAARQATARQLAGQVKKGRLTDEQAQRQVESLLTLITGTLDYADFGDVDIVIEAVPERIDIKQSVMAELDAVTPGHAILASNTSGLSITQIGQATLRPEKVIGFHYFFPASVMPLIEIARSQDSTSETIQTAVGFAQAIRKQPIVCAEVPGFVVNRILLSAVAEIWSEQQQQGLDVAAIDAGFAARGDVMPMPPFRLTDAVGLDVVHDVAEQLAAAYGSRFYVHDGIGELVATGHLGAKSGGEGVYSQTGDIRLAGSGIPNIDELVEKLQLKMFCEACAVLEEGVASHRDIDLGMMAGAGIDPKAGFLPPFMAADEVGLDKLLMRLERATERWDDNFDPPLILRRLVAQGRLGKASGQGFYPYPQPDAEQPAATVLIETRGDVAIAWLANGPMNSLGPQTIADLRTVWDTARAGGAHAFVIASANPMLFCAGADIKAFTGLNQTEAQQYLDGAHALFREFESAKVATIAAVNGLAFGGGNELAIACDIRIAAQSALLGQPEIKLGIIPGFGGTQRVARLVGTSAALELNLTGDPIMAEDAYTLGLVSRVVADHEMFDTALIWARGLAEQAPLALEQIKRVSANGDLDAGLKAEKEAFGAVFASADAREGIAAFLGKRKARWQGR